MSEGPVLAAISQGSPVRTDYLKFTEEQKLRRPFPAWWREVLTTRCPSDRPWRNGTLTFRLEAAWDDPESYSRILILRKSFIIGKYTFEIDPPSIERLQSYFADKGVVTLPTMLQKPC